jgi:predicted peptidase
LDLDLFLPEKASSSEKLPLVIFVHGEVSLGARVMADLLSVNSWLRTATLQQPSAIPYT